MAKRITLLLLLLCISAFSQSPLALIPQPQSIKINKGFFVINKKTVIQADPNMFEAQFLQQAIIEQTGMKLKIVPAASKVSKICLSHSVDEIQSDNSESYKLNISKTTIVIAAEQNEGLFNGIQTLLQIIPFEKKQKISLPRLKIYDQPKYAWRGMHLDVSRHFFPVDFVKKYIDYLVMYKFNTFHWHLTDDQGWRIEIKKYPKLTDVGAWRNGSMIGHYNDKTYDDIHYGGFYTQEEIKDIVSYATQRHITIVPEIEMPGHSRAALAAYPEYSCAGGPFEVAKRWGGFEDVFCPKEETFTFLEDILTEVMELFPSQYIHVGGDECPKTRWKNCPNCQSIIKENGLKDEHELQSYFVQRIEKFINSKGKKLIGWDEILEGGLAPNATVMSWRGTEGGITAAKQHHFVIMSPGSYCYFDHYQGDPKSEPLAIGGYTTVEKVYSYNPTPSELNAEEATYILGAQANVWTEYINTPQNVEYMIFPRMLALSEVLWGTSNPTNFPDFQTRMIQQFPTFDKKNINYSKAIFEVTSNVNPSLNGENVLFTLKSAYGSKGIHFTIDGSIPNINSEIYDTPILINQSETVRAAYFENNKQQSAVIEQSFFWNKATGKKITLVNQPHQNYSNGGAFTLVDGIQANRSKIGRDWLGFLGKDMDATIDLGKEMSVNKVKVSVLSSEGSWIYYPTGIEVLISNDGQNFQSIKHVSLAEIQEDKGNVIVEIEPQNAQYIKVIANNMGTITEGNPGAGSAAWLFVDEIGVE
jgi:hexosaminidase